MKRLPFGCIFAQGCKMEVTGTEKGTNVVFLYTTVDDGEHFQQILAWTLKSRWQNPERFRGCAKLLRVSGVKSNVLHDQSAHAQIQITLLRRITFGSLPRQLSSTLRD